jgi:hypothetical protein
MYGELKRKNFFCVVTAPILALLFAPGLAWAQKSAATYYVSAAGNDDNDRLSEASAFRTLSRAVIQAGFLSLLTLKPVLRFAEREVETGIVFYKQLTR